MCTINTYQLEVNGKLVFPSDNVEILGCIRSSLCSDRTSNPSDCSNN